MSKRNKSQNIYMEGVLETFYLIISLSNNARFSVPWGLGTTILSVKWAICTKVVEVMNFCVIKDLQSNPSNCVFEWEDTVQLSITGIITSPCPVSSYIMSILWDTDQKECSHLISCNVLTAISIGLYYWYLQEHLQITSNMILSECMKFCIGIFLHHCFSEQS
jgi:hypothetical protein